MADSTKLASEHREIEKGSQLSSESGDMNNRDLEKVAVVNTRTGEDDKVTMKTWAVVFVCISVKFTLSFSF